MPLFNRPDGTVLKDLPFVRRMMPYLMKGRNEAVVYHEQNYDVTKTRKWLQDWNRKRGDRTPATLFHLFVWSAGRALSENPDLNRFVSGGRIYQRNKVHITFAAKKSFDVKAPLVTVKVEINKDEPFDQFVDRIVSLIGEGRAGKDRAGKERKVDKELRLVMKLPHFFLRFFVWIFRTLDRFNLAPASMLDNDPMYTSIFLANLGSVGLDNTYHHLYEWGTCPLFGVMGTVKKEQVVGRDGKPYIRDGVQCRWSFDERVNDGFYCMVTLRDLKEFFENPDKYAEIPRVVPVGDEKGAEPGQQATA